MQVARRICPPVAVFFVYVLFTSLGAWSQTQPHVISVIADKDSRYRIPGQKRAEIVVKASEPVLLRIEARKGKTWNRDGTVHGFVLLRARDRAKVPGWNLELTPGSQEFPLTAPAEPGEYEVVCTVICSDDHEGMRMKLLVVR
jgi:heme/copper-type cytochrome/quinol oxidase subunit 2